MKTDPLAADILHAVGLPAQWNDEFVLATITAVAAWKRWSRESAAKWLRARAVAHMEIGTTIDKWWFVNGDYRVDPRPVEVISSGMAGKPDCRECGGTGWALVSIGVEGGAMQARATKCQCRGGKSVRKMPPVSPGEIGAILDAKKM
jgi:hypothetical protein